MSRVQIIFRHHNSFFSEPKCKNRFILIFRPLDLHLWRSIQLVLKELLPHCRDTGEGGEIWYHICQISESKVYQLYSEVSDERNTRFTYVFISWVYYAFRPMCSLCCTYKMTVVVGFSEADRMKLGNSRENNQRKLLSMVAPYYLESTLLTMTHLVLDAVIHDTRRAKGLNARIFV